MLKNVTVYCNTYLPISAIDELIESHTHEEYLTEHQDISGKADKATTLEGYGITNTYTTLNTQFGDPMAEGYVSPWNK